MLERILLAAVITFCVYLFLNLGEKASSTPTINAEQGVISGFVEQIASISF
ncbi:MAG: hypothetical protein HC939_09265 [Pleurocapsa sp. SU_5_0]|jgi:hypothetical protein|nr:hypothetical protein [Pleurocapsa sp. SU_5_0]NJO97769.1 hypothetical protein [Pleurocapsa sp. CRU_1_2]NJR45466.1 hypothetical protein [Hyellaceae cyanobacterium CSU_1_1]